MEFVLRQVSDGWAICGNGVDEALEACGQVTVRIVQVSGDQGSQYGRSASWRAFRTSGDEILGTDSEERDEVARSCWRRRG
ncbi:hypothetical protein [Streptomyces hainanensis]|uniref:Uncharacterized protein n=1 Tax=Streptomyces hainanensis TaxID=402648 RepID=A0A4R4TBY2_9ACTN|nr:hypothetical protein [Streptomyces hainanensis]TDC72622.1 hypothetical protein E1283_21290 [Streptomyces hainanensis]